MIAVEGYFEGDRFYTDRNVRIPQRKRAIVTILDEPVLEIAEKEKQAWFCFFDKIAECDEPLEGEPERTNFKREIDL